MYQQRCWSTVGQPDQDFHQPLIKAGKEILPKGYKTRTSGSDHRNT